MTLERNYFMVQVDR